MKKALAYVLSAMMLASVFTGCGKTTENPSTASTTSSTTTTKGETSDNATTNSDKPITLRFSWWGGDARQAATLEVISQFEKLYPNITIEPEYGSSDGYTDKLSTQLAAGTAPDIIQIDPGIMPSLLATSSDYFIDYNSYDFDFSNFEENYYKQKINGCYDNKQVGIPTGISGSCIIVNQDLATKIGIDFSKDYTFDDLLEWGKKVHEYDNSMYLLCDNKDSIAKMLVSNYIKQLTGQTYFNEDTKKLNITEEQFKQVFTYVKTLYDNYVVPPASYMAAYSGDNLQSDPNWIAGKYVGSLTYLSTAEVLTAANPSATFVSGKLPVMANAKSDGWFSNCPQLISVNAKSKNIEAAVKFVDYFFNNENAMATLGATRSVPSTEKAREITFKNGSLSGLLSTATDTALGYKGMTDDKYYQAQEAIQVIIDAVEAVGYGTSTPDSAASDSVNLLENYVTNAK